MTGTSAARTALAAITAIAGLTMDAAALTGTVKNSAGYTVPGANVLLASDTNVRHTTGADGSFALTPTNLLFSGAGNTPSAHAIRDVALRDGRLDFTLSSPARNAELRMTTVGGAARFEVSPGRLAAGPQHVVVPRLAPGLYVLRVSLNGRPAYRRLLHVGEGVAATGARPGERTSASTAFLAKAAAVDTVLVRKRGYLTAKVPVTAYSQTDMDITLAADTIAALPVLADVGGYSVDGPFATVVEANVGPGNNYTIVRPATLGENGFLHAPIIYGHGINGQVSGFTAFLRSVASHGFVIIARNVLTGGPNNANNTAAMNDGLNWILAQDTIAGSLYYGKLATDRAASMGYSVGGTAAVDIGAHPALKTVVSIHGHISSATLHGTLLQTTGTNDNVGLPMQEQTYANSVVPTFLGTVTDAGHGYIQNANGGVQRPAIIAWLRLRLYNDAGARVFFYGDACVLCTAPWENPQRKNWE